MLKLTNKEKEAMPVTMSELKSRHQEVEGAKEEMQFVVVMDKRGRRYYDAAALPVS